MSKEVGNLLFLKKKKQKDFFNSPAWAFALSLPQRRDSGSEVFWFFFSKKNCLARSA
jgi:hypothetical protein